MQNGFLLVHQWFLGDSFMYSTAIIFISFFYGYGKRSKVFQCSHIIHEKKHFESLLIKQKSLHVQSWFFQDFLSWWWLCIPVGVVLIMNLLTYFFFQPKRISGWRLDDDMGSDWTVSKDAKMLVFFCKTALEPRTPPHKAWDIDLVTYLSWKTKTLIGYIVLISEGWTMIWAAFKCNLDNFKG